MATIDLADRLGRKPLAVLVYLAINGGPASRGEVADLVWPDAEPTRARHNLRSALWAIRKELEADGEALLDITADEVGLSRDPALCDLPRLRQIEAGAPTSPEEILDLCRGPLLEGFTTSSAPFEGLLADLREDYDARMIAVLRGALETLNEADQAMRQRIEARLALFDAPPPQARSTASPATETPSPGIARSGMRMLAYVALGFAIAVIGFAALLFTVPETREAVANLTGHGPAPTRIGVHPFDTANSTDVERALAGGVTVGVNYALYVVGADKLTVVTIPPEARPGDWERLDVQYVISGRLQVENGNVRVTVSYQDVATGEALWQHQFNNLVTNTISLQDEIVLEILSRLSIDLSTAERNRLQYLNDTKSLQAWLFAADGVRNLIKLDPDALEQALSSYRKALQLDPNYISARRGLAWHALLKVRFGTAPDPEAAIVEARQHLDVILRKRPDDGMSKALEGLMLLIENRWEDAVAAGEAATELLPGSADVWAVLSHSYSFIGQYDKALEAIERAMQLSPGHPHFYKWLRGRAHRLSGDYDEAISDLLSGYGPDSNSIVQLVELSSAYAATGQFELSRDIGRRIREIDPDFSASEWVQHPAAAEPDQQSREFELLSQAGL